MRKWWGRYKGRETFTFHRDMTADEAEETFKRMSDAFAKTDAAFAAMNRAFEGVRD